MRDDLLFYYDRELAYIRHSAAQFAQKYPKIASRLALEPDKCEDPHVERLLEAFSFLAARIHLKIDDEFPEITEALLGIVYPHLIRPIPSMSIVQFVLDSHKGKLTTGLSIARDSMLYSRPVDLVPCKFRTCYDTTLWPIQITDCRWKTPDRLAPPAKAADAVAVIGLELQTPGDLPISALDLDQLRFHLTGDSGMVQSLYELLCCNVTAVQIRDLAAKPGVAPLILPRGAVQPAGFGPDQGMLPFDRRSFLGYRLLFEYFTFPEKFLFIDLWGLKALAGSGFSNRVELLFFISRFEGDQRLRALETGLTARTFRLGCVPVVNLFQQTAEPILLDQYKYEYRVTPDIRRPHATEIFSIDEVVSQRSDREIVSFEPFYSIRHAASGKLNTLWIANRRLSDRPGDSGTDIHLSLVDLDLNPSKPPVETLTIRTTCTNRDLPSRLPFGNETGDFELEGGAPIKHIVALTKPTQPIRPPIGKALQWRMISHLSLNYLSLVEDGKQALQEILKLYDFTSSKFAEKVINGITRLDSSPHFARIVSGNNVAFARGAKVQIEVDEDQFVGGGAYLFLSVLENFLGLYASLNSFTQLSAVSRQRKEGFRQWPPRAGRRILM